MKRIAIGMPVTCTFTPGTNATFFFMVGRGFTPLFGHGLTNTFTAKYVGPASITIYWSQPGLGSQTATFNYTIAPAP